MHTAFTHQTPCPRVIQLLQLLQNHPTNRLTTRILAIDGRCASGKTTIAAQLSAVMGASVIHMDDFFLPPELRTPQRFASPGGNIHHERFALEVLPFLRNGQPFLYRIFDCTIMDYKGVREVAAAPIRIIEGSYSHHPILGKYGDVCIFSDIDSSTQLERIKKRNGEKAAAVFNEKWIPMEEAYIRTYQIDTSADITI